VRNNQDRLGAVPGGEGPPVQQQQTEQPLQFVTPTEFVELPSRGKFYPEGHPLHNVETIEIRHMTAKDEDILTSTALLRKGIAIDRLLRNVIIDRSINIADLLVGDKNALILASRITGYGADYEAAVNCPSCNSSVKFEFDLSQCEITPHNRHEEHDVVLTDNNTFIIHVDKLDLDVEVKLLISKDEIEMLQLSERRRKKKLPESHLTDQLRRIIVSVGGKTNRSYIESFIEAMPAIDSRKLRNTYQNIVPNVDMNHDFACSECSYEGEVSVPFGANFFWPK
jgi:hypothetical protein